MICAVVLAAGASRRMGKNKLLLPYGETNVICHIVSTLLTCSIEKVIVVTGHNPLAVQDALHDLDVSFAHNDNPDAGMLSSVRCGLRALPDACSGVLVALGDHPTVDKQTVSRVIAGFQEGGEIVVPKFGERRGHPLLFSSKHKDKVLHDFDHCGLRGLLQEYQDRVVELECNSDAPILDLDTPEDYEKLMCRHPE